MRMMPPIMPTLMYISVCSKEGTVRPRSGASSARSSHHLRLRNGERRFSVRCDGVEHAPLLSFGRPSRPFRSDRVVLMPHIAILVLPDQYSG